MSLWYCACHGLHGPMAGCSLASRAEIAPSTPEALKRPAQSLAMKKYHAERKKKAKLAAASIKRHAKRRAVRDEPGHVVTCDPAFDVGLVE